MKAKEFIEKHPDWVRVIIHDGDLEELEEFLNQFSSNSDKERVSVEDINKQFPLPENGKSGIITGLEKAKRMGAMWVINQLKH